MIEKAHKFGIHGQLIGIATIPEDAASTAKRPAVLFLNSGLLHRVGPYRLYVDLSRILAAAGFFSMRFDLSGIGDSQFTHDVLSYKEKVKDDVQSAMNFVQQKYNCEKFILIGLCSGAVNSHLVASVDNRVVGVVLMDGFAFPTPGFYYIRCKNFITKRVGLLLKIRDIFDRWVDALRHRGSMRRQRGRICSRIFHRPGRKPPKGLRRWFGEKSRSYVSIPEVFPMNTTMRISLSQCLKTSISANCSS
jgi:hypothetical protein